MNVTLRAQAVVRQEAEDPKSDGRNTFGGPPPHATEHRDGAPANI